MVVADPEGGFRGRRSGRPGPPGAPDPGAGLDGVTAVVLTHRRPRLAGAAVRSLLFDEGFTPDRVVLVVNGDGGLDDPELERSIRVVRLAENFGPAEGFRRGLLEAFEDPAISWAYLCEDDVSLLHLPVPRVAGLLSRVSRSAQHGPVGAIVAFGRVFVERSGHTNNFVPRRGLPGELARADVSTWGATLVSRSVVDAGVLPDPELFFGFEDFDFFCRMRAAGLALLVDVPTARDVVQHQSLVGRDDALRGWRPTDAEEPWRAYYFARNFFALARRHGRPSWLAWHLLYSVRRLQLAASGAERRAIVHGLWHGAIGRLGVHRGYLRQVGERAHAPSISATAEPRSPVSSASSPDEERSVSGDAEQDERALAAPLERGVVAMVLTHNAPATLRRCLTAITEQSSPPAAIVVIDNASSPRVDPGDLPRTPPIAVLRSEVNLGPAGGWAMAFEHFRDSSFDHAWVLDDDILPDPDCLEALLDASAGDPKAAFCFPRSIQPDGTVGEWGSWCGFVVARAIVEQVGVPRAELFWWAEDNEYCHWRIPQAGFARRIVDGALVQHDAVRQGARVPTWKYYYEARNMLYLHLHVMHRVGWYPRNVTKLLARAIMREKGKRLRSLVAIARGLADGLTGRLGIRFPIEPMREQIRGGDRGAHGSESN